MPDPNKNLLIARLRTIRDGRTQGQFELELRTKYPAFTKKNYISKVETGTPQELDPGFVEAIASELKVDPATVIDWWNADASVASRTFDVVAGHTLWNAPLVMAALSGQLSSRHDPTRGRLRLATFGRRGMLHWVEGAGLPDLLPGCESLGVHDQPVPLTARDALERLLEGEADIAVVPAQLALPKSTLSVGHLVDSASGASMVMRSDVYELFGGEQPPLPVGTADLAAKLGGKKIGYLEDTVAASFLDDVKEFQSRSRNEAIKPVSLASEKLHEISGLLTPGELDAFIVWEPQATWIQRRAPKDRTLKKVPVYFSFTEEHPQRHLRMDVLIRRDDSEDRVLGGAALRLMKVMASAIEVLNIALSGNRHQDRLHQLAKYFDLKDLLDLKGVPAADGSKEQIWSVVRALSAVNFSAALDPSNIQEFVDVR